MSYHNTTFFIAFKPSTVVEHEYRKGAGGKSAWSSAWLNKS